MGRSTCSLAISLMLGLCAGAQAAERVVSLMPAYTEIVFALGAGEKLVGVSNYCNWPPEAAKIERTGDYLNPSLEKIFALKPDLVIAGAWAKTSQGAALRKSGAKVVFVDEEKSAEDILANIGRLAAVLGRAAEGERLKTRLHASLPPPVKGRPLKVYVEADAGGWTPGGQSFLNDAVRLAGGENIFGREKRGYLKATWEEVLLLAPEAVVLLNGSREEFLARPMAADLPAVKAGRVITGLDRDVFSRPGPRLFEGITKLRGALYGEK